MVKNDQFSEDYIKERIASVSYWFHSIEVAPGISTPGATDPASRLHEMGIPERLDGKTVLDVGACDGFYSFECERRGAKVTATDVRPGGFLVAKELLGSKVEFKRRSVYELDPKDLEQFDIVLCMGLIYHLRHPLMALDCLYDMCRELMILESHVCDNWFIDKEGRARELQDFSPELLDYPIARFYPGRELRNDPSNWWSPNEICLRRMLESSGYEVTLHNRIKARAVFHCRKGQRPTGQEFIIYQGLRSKC